MNKYRKYCPHCTNIGRWKFWLLGIIVLAVILIIIFPATLLTTFGGITAPIVGVLSTWLLYITFGEQQKFNCKQIELQKQHADNTILSNLQEQIQAQVNSLRTNINEGKVQIAGLFGLEQLNRVFYHDNKIEFVDFQVLCNHLKILGNGFELFLKTNFLSSLSFENKMLYYQYVSNYIAFICQLYHWAINKHIEIIENINHIAADEDDKGAIDILIQGIDREKTKLKELQKQYLPKQK